MTTLAQINEDLAQKGVSKTVYALTMPEIRLVIDRILGGMDSEEREAFHDMYEEPWMHKQDAAHKLFLSTWLDWTSSVLELDDTQFPHQYPTSGAGEGLKEVVYAYGAAARVDHFMPAIHVFMGEYEGVSSYAQAAGIPVIQHDRTKWRETLDDIGSHDLVYFSQPSAIDGNIWTGYDDFMKALAVHEPRARVVLDLTYVGAVAREYKIKADYPNVDTILFSLSKPMGVYYHRIGGCLMRNNSLGLNGNIWFKNLLSLEIGARAMQAYGVYDLPRAYQHLQQHANDAASQKLGMSLSPCDVFLLAAAKPSSPITPVETVLLRGSPDESRVRVCLTPTLKALQKQQGAPLLNGARP